MFPEILTKEDFNESNPDFNNALNNLSEKAINSENYQYLTRIYNATKDLYVRNRILKLLFNLQLGELKDFFLAAYKRERYLDMKINALRGLSNYVSENEIAKLLVNFNIILAKRQISTPYNYQEYELLRGEHALPFLLNKYGYNCFRETLDQVNRQYDSMPETFKGIFTTEKQGKITQLKKSNAVRNIFDRFFGRNKK